jgi:hypothetical protein
VAAAVLSASIACSGGSDTAPSQLNSASSNQATISVAVRPSPITATRCAPQCSGASGSSSFTFAADMTIDMLDSASVGATVNSIALTGTADGKTFSPVTISSDDIKQLAGSNHVDAHATLSLPVSVAYNTPSGNANLNVSISVQSTDDRGNQVTATGQVSVS